MILSVQYMRAIASILVLMHHAAWKGEQYSTNPMDWFHVGTSGVDLFFIISGYIMCHVVTAKKQSFVIFLKSRCARILPLYWLLTTIALFGFIFFPEKINSSGGVTDILNSYILFPTNNKYLIQNGWTLSYEFYFYVIFSIGFFFDGICKYVVPAAIIIFLVIIGAVLAIPASSTCNFFFSFFLLEFVYGIIAFLILKKIKFSKYTSVCMLLLSIVCMVYVNINGFSGYRVLYYGLPCFVLFVSLVSLERFCQIYKNNWILRFFEKLGESSYSLYLVHPFVLVVLSVILYRAGIASYGLVFILTLISCSMALGHCCYYFLEKKISLSIGTRRVR